MLSFYGPLFVRAMTGLSNLSGVLGPMVYLEAPVSDDLRKNMQGIVGALDDPMAQLPFSYSLREEYERFKITLGNSTDPKELSILSDNLMQNLIAELTSKVFLVIPEEHAEFYRQSEPPFGETVASVFSEAEYDIRHASRCIALNEWTATVFYLMRAVELALQALAERLKIKDVNIKEWAKLLQDIDRVLLAMRQKRRTAKRDSALQFYSQARASIAGFNEAWRKHVMHSRGKYDEDEAVTIYQHVKALMQQLASGV